MPLHVIEMVWTHVSVTSRERVRFVIITSRTHAENNAPALNKEAAAPAACVLNN